MASLERMVELLKKRGVLKSEALEQAFLKVNRRDFILRDEGYLAYGDHPLPIGWGQTISQPFTVAFMLSQLDVQSGQKVLDIGSGSGWTTALLACLTGPSGSVLGLERIGELVEYGRANLRAYNFSSARIEQAGPVLGDPGSAYDRILVSASAPSFPEELCGQLNPGGILLIPVANSIWKIIKKGETLIKSEYYGFVFVPLVY